MNQALMSVTHTSKSLSDILHTLRINDRCRLSMFLVYFYRTESLKRIRYSNENY